MALVLVFPAASASYEGDYGFNGTAPLTDYSDNNRDGSVIGSPTTGVSGPYDTGWTFDGSNDKVNLTSNPMPSGLQDTYTVTSTWSSNDFSSTRNLFWFKENNNLQARVESDGSLNVYHDDGSTTGLSFSTSTDTNYCSVIRYDGSTFSLDYMSPSDSSLTSAGSASVGDMLNDADGGDEIGEAAGQDRFWSGEIYDLKVSSTDLSDSEVVNICQTGSATSESNSAPSVSNIDPSDGATEVNDTIDDSPVDVDISFDVSDADGDSLSVELQESDGTVLNSWSSVSSGTTLNYTWENLSSGTEYDWRVNVSDGTDSTLAGNYSFKTAISSETISNNLSNWWKLNEDSGSSIDSIGDSDAVWSGSPTSTNLSLGLDDEGALDLDGSSDFLDIQNNISHLDNSYTISFGFEADATDATRNLLWIYSNNNIQVRVESDGTLNAYHKDISDTTHGVSSSIQTGVPYYGSLRYDGDEISLWLNGTQQDTVTGVGETIQGDEDGTPYDTIGSRRNGQDRFWDGVVDELSIHDRDLNSSEISDLHSIGLYSTESSDEPVEGSLSSTILQPGSSHTVDEGNIFDFEVNVSCSDGDCGEVDTFSYFNSSTGSASDMNLFGSLYDVNTMDRAHDSQAKVKSNGEVYACVPSKNTGYALLNNTDPANPVVMDTLSAPDAQACNPLEGEGYEDYWLTGDDNGMHVLDASDPNNIQISASADGGSWDNLNGVRQNGSLVWAADKDGYVRFANVTSTTSLSVIGTIDVPSSSVHDVAHWDTGGMAVSINVEDDGSGETDDYCKIDYWDDGSSSFNSFPYSYTCHDIDNFDYLNRGEVAEDTGTLYVARNVFDDPGHGFASVDIETDTTLDTVIDDIASVGMAKYPEENPDYIIGVQSKSASTKGVHLVDISDPSNFSVVSETSPSVSPVHDGDTWTDTNTGNDFFTVSADSIESSEDGMQNYEIVENGSGKIQLRACPSDSSLCLDSGSQPQTSILANSSYQPLWSINASKPGNYTLFSESTSNRTGVSNSSSQNVDLTVEAVDVSAPSITIDSPLNQTYNTNSTDLNVASSEPANFTWNVDGGTNQTSAEDDTDLNETLTGLSDGSHTVTVYATDSAGNTGSESVGFTVDTSPSDDPPSVSLSLNSSSIDENESVEAQVSGSDDFQADSVGLDWTSDGNYEETVQGSTLTAVRQFNSTGSFTVTAKATDNNSQSTTTSKSLEVNAVVTATNKSVIPTCTNATSDDAFCIENQTNTKTFSNGFTPEDNTTVTMNVSPRVSSGNYTFFGFANSTGTHNSLIESQKYNVTVTDSSTTGNQLPSADFSISPSSPVAGESITFDGSSSSDPDGNITSFEWDWTGDGSYEDTGETATQTYSSSGDYTVNLRVTDNDGATSTVSKTLTVGDNTTDGDGGGGGGGGDLDDGDTNTSTGGTASLGNSTVRLQTPHQKARYGFTNVLVAEGNSTTVLVKGTEVSLQTNTVFNTSTAEVEVGGTVYTVDEEDKVVEVNGGNLFVTDVIDTPQGKYAAFAEEVTAPLVDLNASVPLTYNYSVEKNVEVTIQYQETGLPFKWTNLSSKNYSQSETGINTSEFADLESGAYEARILISNGSESKSTNPIGFYTGQTPDVEITRPEQGEVITRGENPYVRLPLNFRASTINETKFGAKYIRLSDEKVYSVGEVDEDKITVENDEFTLFDLVSAIESAPWSGFLTENEYGIITEFIGLPEGTDFSADLDMRVDGQTGNYRAYVHASDNSSSFAFNTTSFGKTAYLNIINGSEQTDQQVLEQSGDDAGLSNASRNYNKSLNAQNSEQDNNFSINTSGGNQSGVFEAPYWNPVIPASNQSYTPEFSIDLKNGDVPFVFGMGHGGNISLNRTAVIERNDELVAEVGLQPDRDSYGFSVAGSELPNGTWQEGNYTYYVRFENETNILYSTEDNLQGEMKFTVKRRSVRELVSRWFSPVVDGLTTVYDFTEERAGFLIAMFMIGGWFAGFKINNFEYLSRWGAAGWFLFFSWYGFIPGVAQALVIGLASLFFTMKIIRGDSSL